MTDSKTVYEFMARCDQGDSLPFDEWRESLEEAVRVYNEEHGTNFDPHETFLSYVNREL